MLRKLSREAALARGDAEGQYRLARPAGLARRQELDYDLADLAEWAEWGARLLAPMGDPDEHKPPLKPLTPWEAAQVAKEVADNQSGRGERVPQSEQRRAYERGRADYHRAYYLAHRDKWARSAKDKD